MLPVEVKQRGYAPSKAGGGIDRPRDRVHVRQSLETPRETNLGIASGKLRHGVLRPIAALSVKAAGTEFNGRQV